MLNIDQIIDLALSEDIGDGDHTSLSVISGNLTEKAQLLVKEQGVLCGVDLAKKIFEKFDKTLIFNQILSDGSKINFGDIAFTIEGNPVSILSCERLVLNFMQRLSGIATATSKIVNELKGLNTKILDTRKTTPLLRELEKYAVKTGGGENHRFGLFDMIMIKDNHVDYAGGIQNAINQANKYLLDKGKKLRIEIEVRDFEELQQVLDCGRIDRIMLDNFSPERLKTALQIIGGRYETEASGGITIENIREYALTGVDFISVGALTHHIKSLDLSLKAC